MADIKAIKELALYAAKKQVPVEFAQKNPSATIEDVNNALRAELKEICGTYKLYRKNKTVLFEILEETMDEVVPAEVLSVIGQFADFRNYPHGVKPQFKVKKGKMRARKFATRATASGVYEAFRLDTDIVDVPTFVIGDAAYIDFERFLSGIEDWADYMEALLEGILFAIYNAINDCLQAAAATLGNYNMLTKMEDIYSTTAMVDAVAKVRSYGAPVIVADEKFAAAMGPDAIYSGMLTTPTNGNGIAYAPDDIEAIHKFGHVLSFRGTPVVVLPHVVTSDKNDEFSFDYEGNLGYAYILPSNGEKVVKVAMEGGTIIKDWDNRDNSMEIQAYTKVGTAVVTYNNWGLVKIVNEQ